MCNHLKEKRGKKPCKKQITFNSFLRDGSGGCEAQLQNANRLNQTSQIINKHKPNCYISDRGQNEEENNLDVIAPFDVIAHRVQARLLLGPEVPL